MPKTSAEIQGDTTPVIGGVDLPAHLTSGFPADDAVPSDDLGRQAYWLLKLHPDKVSPRFRHSDLSKMDDATKRLLIADIQHALGIAPFTGKTL